MNIDGRILKGDIVEIGVRIWDVSVESGIPYSQLSAVLNNRRSVTPSELSKIRAAILKLGAKRDV